MSVEEHDYANKNNTHNPSNLNDHCNEVIQSTALYDVRLNFPPEASATTTNVGGDVPKTPRRFPTSSILIGL